MNDDEWIVLRRSDLRGVLNHAADLYDLGGPPIAGYALGWESDEFFGLVIAYLDDPDLFEREHYEKFLRDHLLDRVEGLRALLRLAASNATMSTLSWILDEPLRGGGIVDEETVRYDAAATLPPEYLDFG